MITPKVLFLTYEFEDLISGGIGRVINGLAKALIDQVDFDVFLFRWCHEIENFSGDLYKNGKEKESFFDDYRDRVLQLVMDNNYNIFHVLHVGEHTYDIVKLLREKNIDIQIVYSAHSIAKFEKNIRKNPDTNLLHEEFILNNSNHIHLLSGTGKNWLFQSYPELIDKKCFHVIPNAIEVPDDIKSSTLKSKIVLCMSRWSHGKGIEYLIEAAPKVLTVFPEARFIIAGRKINTWEHDVHIYIEELDSKIEQLSPAVTSLGWIDDEEKDKLMASASVCVMPSELEYFPYAILEPVAVGLPVISSRIPSVQDLVIEGQDCLMFEVGSSAELAEKIIKLFKESDMGESMARSAHEKISKKYRWELVSKAYADMYQKISA